MNFEKTCEDLQRKVSERRMNKWLGEKKKSYQNLISCLRDDVKKLVSEKEVETTGDFKSEIASKLNELINLLEIEPHTEYFNNFVRNLIRLVFNWNKELGNEDIKEKLNQIDRLVEEEPTEREKISILRKLLKKLEKYERYQPESLELSRHYLKSLEEE